jgi:hypothetical protein
MSAYLWVSRWPIRWFTTESEWFFLCLSVGVGVACLAWLPIKPMWRIIFILVYIPTCGFLLLLYGFAFVAYAFGDYV